MGLCMGSAWDCCESDENKQQREEYEAQKRQHYQQKYAKYPTETRPMVQPNPNANIAYNPYHHAPTPVYRVYQPAVQSQAPVNPQIAHTQITQRRVSNRAPEGIAGQPVIVQAMPQSQVQPVVIQPIHQPQPQPQVVVINNTQIQPVRHYSSSGVGVGASMALGAATGMAAGALVADAMITDAIVTDAVVHHAVDHAITDAIVTDAIVDSAINNAFEDAIVDDMIDDALFDDGW